MLGQLHAILGIVVVVAAAALAVMAGVAAWRDRFHALLERGRTVVLGIIGLQVAVGAIRWITGDRPEEGLHLLYGAVALGVLPLAASFASDAPPRPRAGVTAAAAVLLLFVGWRLFVTG